MMGILPSVPDFDFERSVGKRAQDENERPVVHSSILHCTVHTYLHTCIYCTWSYTQWRLLLSCSRLTVLLFRATADRHHHRRERKRKEHQQPEDGSIRSSPFGVFMMCPPVFIYLCYCRRLENNLATTTQHNNKAISGVFCSYYCVCSWCSRWSTFKKIDCYS